MLLKGHPTPARAKGPAGRMRAGTATLRCHGCSNALLRPVRPRQQRWAPLPPPLLPQRRGGAAPGLTCRASSSGSGSDDVSDILKKYSITPAQPEGKPQRRPAPRAPPAPAPLARSAGNGVFFLLILNVAAFFLDHVLHMPAMRVLYLNHAHPQWWQWVTHAFCHANFAHLSANLFLLCVFGKMVEETEGALGVVFAYVVTALGAAAAAVLTQPAVFKGAVSVSLGASGAIFGLFAVSVLTRLSWDPRKLLEGLILGQFVVQQVLQEAKAQAAGGLTLGGLQVGHVAHLGGALAGVLLVWLLSRLPDPGPDEP